MNLDGTYWRVFSRDEERYVGAKFATRAEADAYRLVCRSGVEGPYHILLVTNSRIEQRTPETGPNVTRE